MPNVRCLGWRERTTASTFGHAPLSTLPSPLPSPSCVLSPESWSCIAHAASCFCGPIPCRAPPWYRRNVQICADWRVCVCDLMHAGGNACSCKKEWRLLQSKHHCRLCGQLICEDCQVSFETKMMIRLLRLADQSATKLNLQFTADPPSRPGTPMKTPEPTTNGDFSIKACSVCNDELSAAMCVGIDAPVLTCFPPPDDALRLRSDAMFRFIIHVNVAGGSGRR